MASTPTGSTGASPSTGRPRSAAVTAAALATVLVVLTLATTTSTASAGASGVGRRHPQAVPRAFEVLHGAGKVGNGAVTSDGTYVLASVTGPGSTIAVCTMHKGARSCRQTATLHAYRHDGFGDVAEVLATGGKDVSVVASDCCAIPDDLTLVDFNSTNDGKTFSKEYWVGNIAGLTSAAYTDGQIVAVNNGGKTQVQSFVPADAGKSGFVPSTTEANLITHDAFDAYVATTSTGGILVASDNGSSSYVYFAPHASDFDASGSFHQVGQFGHETVVAVSGDALQTDIRGGLTGDERLRFFNGTKIPARGFKVPEPKNGDDGAFNMVQVGGVVRDVFINRRGYDTYTATTRNGSHWSSLSVFSSGGGLKDAQFNPVEARSGAGVIFETDGPVQYAQPIGGW